MAREQDVERIAKKLDKMVHKKKTVSSPPGAGGAPPHGRSPPSLFCSHHGAPGRDAPDERYWRESGRDVRQRDLRYCCMFRIRLYRFIRQETSMFILLVVIIFTLLCFVLPAPLTAVRVSPEVRDRILLSGRPETLQSGILS